MTIRAGSAERYSLRPSASGFSIWISVCEVTVVVSAERLVDCGGQGFPAGRSRASQVHPQHGSAMGLQGPVVTQGLGLLQGRERVLLARHLDVLGVLLDHLQEDPGGRAALVQLAGRV